jgi:hypothetical protein
VAAIDAGAHAAIRNVGGANELPARNAATGICTRPRPDNYLTLRKRLPMLSKKSNDFVVRLYDSGPLLFHRVARRKLCYVAVRIAIPNDYVLTVYIAKVAPTLLKVAVS